MPSGHKKVGQSVITDGHCKFPQGIVGVCTTYFEQRLPVTEKACFYALAGNLIDTEDAIIILGR